MTNGERVSEKEPARTSVRPSVDKNYMRVMELEKEVLELYKMLEYWKKEAKTIQENSAEANLGLRNQVRGSRMLIVMERVL